VTPTTAHFPNWWTSWPVLISD